MTTGFRKESIVPITNLIITGQYIVINEINDIIMMQLEQPSKRKYLLKIIYTNHIYQNDISNIIFI